MTLLEKNLFSPFELKSYKLKNRIGIAPMTRMSSPGGSVPRQDVLDMLVRRAQAGTALIYTEGITTDNEASQGYKRQARLLTESQIAVWKPVTRGIREAGGVSIAQLFHNGRITYPEVNPAGRVIAPSPIAPKQLNSQNGQPFQVPEEMSHAEIAKVIQYFALSTRGAMEAGFDGIELHGAHAYLISQFLSVYSNQRTDEYGGTTEKRFRFVYELIQAVKAEMPANKLLLFRISDHGAVDPEVSLFETKEEWQKVIRLLVQEPVDAISVSCYDYTRKMYGTDQNLAQLTREVTALPLLLAGKIYDRATAEDALQYCDVVLSGKSLLLNPAWVDDITFNKPLEPFKAKDAQVAYTVTPLP
jgi:2,4-dienoyl-CoA reductase-like NADH-dependent reductase (Old Yellow Enzyme family)